MPHGVQAADITRIFWLLCRAVIFSWLLTAAPINVCSAQSSGLYGTMPSRQVMGLELSRALELKGVSVSLGQPTEGVLIQCAEIRVGSKRIGSVKLGLIPELEVRGMSWEVRGAIPASVWCELVRSFFQREPFISQSCLQGFSLVFDWMKNFRLEAKTAQFEPSRGILLIENLSLEIGRQQLHFNRGELILEGQGAGKLVIADHHRRRLGFKLPFEQWPPEFNKKPR